MQRHRWTCFACGEANTAEVDTCGSCSCPASPTSGEVQARRTDHVRRGGTLRGDALLDSHRDLSAFAVLGRPLLLLLFGWWRR